MRLLGVKGEELAVRFLKNNGYKIISRNFRSPIGEIDIIAEDKGCLVFIEVKTRSGDFFGRPFEAVNHKKMEKLKKVALYYIKNCCRAEMPSRFDVLSIRIDAHKPEIEHITYAFE